MAASSSKKQKWERWTERGQPLLVLANPRDLWVVTNIRESEIAAVRVGNKSRVWVDAYPELRFEGEVVIDGPRPNLRHDARGLSVFSLVPLQE